MTWESSLRHKINRWRFDRYRRIRRGHQAAKNELREAQAWCAAKADLSRPRECLRTEALRPSLLGPTRLCAVDNVRRSRSSTLTYGGVSNDLRSDVTTADGRLIAYFPDLDLSCGVAEMETRGYFDVYNTPPWDSWVALLHTPNIRYPATSLIAWVPSVFVPLVDAGMDLIPESCVMWLDDCTVDLQLTWKEVVTTETEGPRWL